MLRFKNNDGTDFPDWEEKIFGDFLIIHSEKTSNKDSYPLYSLTIESGVQPKTERYEREFLVKKEGDNYKIVPPNAFVYNPMNLRFGALKVNHEKFSVSVSGYYDVFSLKDDSTLAFWENYLVTPRMLNYYFSIATGSLIEKLRVHYSQFVKIKKNVPCFSEQQKISDFLSTIDTVIEKQKATVEAWEERKKGVMQKLFSQEVRFKADNGSEFPDWEEKKMNEIAILNPKTGCIPDEFYYMDLGSVDNGTWNSKIVVKKENAHSRAQRNAMVGECFFQSVRPYNKGHYLLKGNLDKKIVASTGFIQMRMFSEYDSGFVYQMFFLDEFNEKVAVRCIGQTYPAINMDGFSEIQMLFPCLVEQQKIADCLSSLDDVIEKQKATLAAWEEMKKGLLQQMFV